MEDGEEIQPSKAHEEESIMMFGPVRDWPIVLQHSMAMKILSSTLL